MFPPTRDQSSYRITHRGCSFQQPGSHHPRAGVTRMMNAGQPEPAALCSVVRPPRREQKTESHGREPWGALDGDPFERQNGNEREKKLVHFTTRHVPRHHGRGGGAGWRRKWSAARGILSANQQTLPHPSSLPSHHHTRPSSDTCARMSKMQTRSSTKRVTRQSTRATRGTSATSSIALFHPPHSMAHQSQDHKYPTHPRSILHPQIQSAL